MTLLRSRRRRNMDTSMLQSSHAAGPSGNNFAGWAGGELQTKWSAALTDRLRLDFEMDDTRTDTKYSVNLSGYIDGSWRDVVRYDNAHGPAHRHTFHPDREDDEHTFIAVLPVTFFALGPARPS